eukprot:1162913-Amphidinium_carterae.1
MFHEGTIPASANRMTLVEITVSFGHGLRGLLPNILGTLSLLSLWENGLEGHLPELHMIENCTLVVYGNDFSCKLPRHYDVKLTSIAPRSRSLATIFLSRNMSRRGSRRQSNQLTCSASQIDMGSVS